MIRSQDLDVLALQEVGNNDPDPKHLTLEKTTALPAGRYNYEIKQFTWRCADGFERKVYILATGVNNRRLAMVTKVPADELALRASGASRESPRPAFGVRIGSTWFYNIHADSGKCDKGKVEGDAGDLVVAVDEAHRDADHWAVMGDFNCEPSVLVPEGDPESESESESEPQSGAGSKGKKRKRKEYGPIELDPGERVVQTDMPTYHVWKKVGNTMKRPTKQYDFMVARNVQGADKYTGFRQSWLKTSDHYPVVFRPVKDGDKKKDREDKKCPPPEPGTPVAPARRALSAESAGRPRTAAAPPAGGGQGPRHGMVTALQSAITSPNGNLVADLRSSDVRNDTPIQAYWPNGTPAQKWVLWEKPGNKWLIETQLTNGVRQPDDGMVLDHDPDIRRTHLWHVAKDEAGQLNGNANQQWEIKEVAGGPWYTLVSSANRGCLTAASPGAELTVTPCDGSDGQKWRLPEAEDDGKDSGASGGSGSGGTGETGGQTSGGSDGGKDTGGPEEPEGGAGCSRDEPDSGDGDDGSEEPDEPDEPHEPDGSKEPDGSGPDGGTASGGSGTGGPTSGGSTGGTSGGSTGGTSGGSSSGGSGPGGSSSGGSSGGGGGPSFPALPGIRLPDFPSFPAFPASVGGPGGGGKTDPSHGVYVQSARDNKLVPDVRGGNTASDTAVQGYEPNDTDSQKWVFWDRGNGNWLIETRLTYGRSAAGERMAVTHDTGRHHTVLRSATAERTDQLWRFKDAGGGWSTLVNGDGGGCLTLDGAGRPLAVRGCDGSEQQKWKLSGIKPDAGDGGGQGGGDQPPLGEGGERPKHNRTVVLQSGRDRLVSDVDGGSNAGGTRIKALGRNGHDAQRWVLWEKPDGQWLIETRLGGGKVMDHNPDTHRTHLIPAMSGNANQLWRFRDAGAGWYTITSSAGNGCLTATGAQNDLEVRSCDAGDRGQKWRLTDVADNPDPVLPDVPDTGTGTGGTDKPTGGGGTDAGSGRPQAPGGDSPKHGRSSVLQSGKDGLVADLDSASTNSGTRIKALGRNGHDAQRWALWEKPNGQWLIETKLGGGMVVDHNPNTHRAHLIKSQDGNANQLWRLHEGAVGWYRVISAADGGCLTAVNGGADLEVRRCEESAGQWWKLTDSAEAGTGGGGPDKPTGGGSGDGGGNVPDGGYPQAPGGDSPKHGLSAVLMSGRNELVADVDSASTASGTRIKALGVNANDAQRWVFWEKPDGQWLIETKLGGGMVMDHNPDTHRAHLIKSQDGNANQLWRFREGPRGWYRVISAAGGGCLTAADRDGDLAIRSCEASPAQWWHLRNPAEFATGGGGGTDKPGGGSSGGGTWTGSGSSGGGDLRDDGGAPGGGTWTGSGSSGGGDLRDDGKGGVSKPASRIDVGVTVIEDDSYFDHLSGMTLDYNIVKGSGSFTNGGDYATVCVALYQKDYLRFTGFMPVRGDWGVRKIECRDTVAGQSGEFSFPDHRASCQFAVVKVGWYKTVVAAYDNSGREVAVKESNTIDGCVNF
ncbi:RICIN domain-containing protein [Streptomyces sp. AV19]|uniref:RICIN domain-containing protein n=1 Tax=Streptomyces sp. AV19 TaxID=2793068 RepID=UPI0018FF04E3|nr:RICIN domain-containing protein [Streptomyces sp. AV19]MBH1937937.1 RICIN domain-containing protein [Streptomyces sp. AV19]MDG4536575.1 RICIN domain-containing protein [Streptomyces sp. AV19]